MQVKISQAVKMITAIIKAKLVAMLKSSPGLGKSSVVRQIAAMYGLKVIDLRLSQCDPTDLLGFPTINKDGRAGYAPMDTFPIEGDEIPKGYNGWLLFLDEFNSASPAVQAAAYKVVLDRMVGIHNLHPNLAIVCAGNLESDGAIVNPMSTALQSRIVHLELVLDNEEWLAWAASEKLDHRILDFIRFKPGDLYNFTPDHTDVTYACPRTWEFANRIVGVSDITDHDTLPMLAGALGEGVAREFITFCKIYEHVPKPAQIMANPEGVPVPAEPSYLYALTGTLSHNANESNFGQLMKFIKRMPAEFQVVTLKDTVRRNKTMLQHSSMREWVATSAVELF